MTLYDAKKRLMVENSLDRYKIGSADKMTTEKDGSTVIYIQADSPGKDKESNWLPAPKAPFYLLMCMYQPKIEVSRYCLAAFTLLVMAQPGGLANAAGTSSISGQWVGGGIVVLNSGAKEHVRCRVKYGRVAGQTFSLTARCATGATRIDQSGELERVSKNRYVGQVYDKQFGVHARVRITIAGRKQTVAISSSQCRAIIRLKRRR